MTAYTLKTVKNKSSVSKFIGSIKDESRKKEAKILLALMKRASKKTPKMWGESMIGFGEYHYLSKSGIEGDWPLTGFSPRKAAFSIYIMPGFKMYITLMGKLGIYKTGVSCLYVKRLSDIDLSVLERLVFLSVREMEKRYLAK